MLEAPRGLSHPQTSFIGTVCQGIHHTPFRAAHAPKNPNDSFSTPDDKSSHCKKMITKRSISKPDSKKEPGEIAIKQTMTSKSSHCSRPLSSSQTTTHPRNDPDTAHRPADRPKGTSGKPHATKSRVAVREPKSIFTPLPAGPQRNPRSQRSLPHQHAHTTPGTIPGMWATRRTPDRRPENSVERR